MSERSRRVEHYWARLAMGARAGRRWTVGGRRYNEYIGSGDTIERCESAGQRVSKDEGLWWFVVVWRERETQGKAQQVAAVGLGVATGGEGGRAAARTNETARRKGNWGRQAYQGSMGRRSGGGCGLAAGCSRVSQNSRAPERRYSFCDSGSPAPFLAAAEQKHPRTAASGGPVTLPYRLRATLGAGRRSVPPED